MSVACWACDADVDPGRPDASGYASCDRCGLRFFASGQAPRTAYADSYFAAYRGGNYYDTEPIRRHEARCRLALVAAATDDRGDLLEVGSAAGFFLDEARAAGWGVAGVEPSASAAAFARERLGLELLVGFAEDLDLPQASFAAACMWHTLEHVPAPHSLLETLRTALRPGAPLLIEVPNGGALLAGRLGTRWPPLESDVHVAQWTPSALASALSRAGFTDVKVATVPFLTYVPGRLGRALRRVKLALLQRRWLREPHPDGHELLRAVARRPTAP